MAVPCTFASRPRATSNSRPAWTCVVDIGAQAATDRAMAKKLTYRNFMSFSAGAAASSTRHCVPELRHLGSYTVQVVCGHGNVAELPFWRRRLAVHMDM